MKYSRNKEWADFYLDKDGNIKEFLEYFSLNRKWLNKIKLNNKDVSPESSFNNGDVLSVVSFEKEQIDYLPEGNVEIIYEDDWLLVVNKPAGIIIYPENKEGKGTLVNRVAKYYYDNNMDIAVRPVHRLDKDTNGLVLFSKSSFIQPKLDNMMKDKEIHRYYLAEVEGIIKNNGTINLPIGKDRHINGKMRVSKSGKQAITHYKVLENKEDTTLLECVLDTGRTHQIRVHLSYKGHPIINDKIYGKVINDKPMALTAYKLKFIHPVTEEKLEIKLF